MDQTDFIPRIKLLSEHVANQIAAGEVIERPASVVKELLENSFDAGAGKINIILEQGGTRLIQVIDNGHGIHPDDLPLALSSHGTSKIVEIDDLFHSNSLGFRGEALPSIASVSNFELISSVDETSRGKSIKTNGSNQLQITPAAHPPGTTVKVENLFYQTPARKKFLRSDKTEYLHVLEIIKCMCLSRFGCEISLQHNKKRVFHCRATDANPDQRIAQVMGNTFIRQSVSIDESRTDMHLWGRLGLAAASRSQSNRQYIYLNGRIIRDRHVNHAIRMAYDGQIPQGRFPSYVLYLNMDLTKSDVNVHPSKYEVRFSNTREVHDFVYAAVKSSLANATALIRENDIVAVPANINNEAGYRASARAKPGFAGGQKVMEPSARTNTLFDRIIGKLNNRYLLAGKDNGLLLCDLLEIRKRIFQYDLEKASANQTVIRRPLLVPVSIEITAAEAKFLESNLELYASCGLEMQQESPVSMLVRTIPVQLEDIDLRALINDLMRIRVKHKDNYRKQCINIFIEQITEESIANISDEQLSGLFSQLAEHNIDLSKPGCKGLWRRLSDTEIQRLLGSEYEAE